jgi:C-terminal processing protease CtpA/Prc
MKNISTKTLLDYISATSSANSEEDQVLLMTLMKPTSDRDEMGEVYECLLGYNPITHFDEQDLNKVYVDIIASECFQKAPHSVKEYLASEENKNELIKRALSLLDDEHDDYLQDIMVDIIKDETSWEFAMPDCEDIVSFEEEEDGEDLCDEEDEPDEEDVEEDAE